MASSSSEVAAPACGQGAAKTGVGKRWQRHDCRRLEGNDGAALEADHLGGRVVVTSASDCGRRCRCFLQLVGTKRLFLLTSLVSLCLSLLPPTPTSLLPSSALPSLLPATAQAAQEVIPPYREGAPPRSQEPPQEDIERVGRAMGRDEEEEARAEFRDYDLNGDNFLDSFEVRDTHQEITQGELHSFFLAIDQNSDGLISTAEYLQFLSSA